jgi:hypothetical protein
MRDGVRVETPMAHLLETLSTFEAISRRVALEGAALRLAREVLPELSVDSDDWHTNETRELTEILRFKLDSLTVVTLAHMTALAAAFRTTEVSVLYMECEGDSWFELTLEHATIPGAGGGNLTAADLTYRFGAPESSEAQSMFESGEHAPQGLPVWQHLQWYRDNVLPPGGSTPCE